MRSIPRAIPAARMIVESEDMRVTIVGERVLAGCVVVAARACRAP